MCRWLMPPSPCRLRRSCFRCVLVAGLVNAFNIIDGFNGLAGGVASLILVGIAYVAFKVGDLVVLTASLTAIGAIAGFMLFNFPRGLVYLGDGGAYLLGFWIGELLILLVARNPQVSAWFPALLCSYPVCEMLFSIYRRAFVRRSHPGMPDMAHLHHLIYKRLVRWLVGPGLPASHEHGNALTSPYLWIITSVGVGPAVVFWQKTLILQIGCVMFAAAYVYAYVRIVRFRSSRWCSLRRGAAPFSGPYMMPLHKNTFWVNFAEALLLAILGTVPILMSSFSGPWL
ncbi:MAG: glycosyltransferase family 4 protein [Sulfuritalea sp.]|nr:glycosyltransferase family 4 protein [Sulfuritalea sp.]